MSHKIAKLILEQAGTFLERAEAVKTAMSVEMTLQEIEEYLDWLDLTRGKPDSDSNDDNGDKGSGPKDKQHPKVG